MVTISPALEDKIERRARRAFSYHDDGVKSRLHRITSVTPTSLKYRIPRSGRTLVEVVRENDTILIDPPTTGTITLNASSDLKKLKNGTGKLHAGDVIAWLISDKAKKVGKTYKKPLEFISRKQIDDKIKRDQFVYEVSFEGADIEDVKWDSVEAKNFTVVSELDPVKDLGFTTGLIDLLTNADVLALRQKRKKHLGTFRGYKYTDKDGKSPVQTSGKLTYEVGKEYKAKNANTSDNTDCGAGINLASVDWCKSSAQQSGNRAFAFEFTAEDIAAVPNGGKFRVHRCDCVEELDTKTFKPLKKAVESSGKKPKKKKGLMDRLLGREGDDE